MSTVDPPLPSQDWEYVVAKTDLSAGQSLYGYCLNQVTWDEAVEHDKWSKHKLAAVTDDYGKQAIISCMEEFADRAWIRSWQGNEYDGYVILHADGNVTEQVDPKLELGFGTRTESG